MARTRSHEAVDPVEEVEVNGIRLVCRRRVEGPPLVLRHSRPTNGREWRGQLEGLSDEFTRWSGA
jgi:pimeloyl-ACP methyl ester carboxylesterase